MARGKRSKAKKKPAKSRKPAKRAKAAAKKPAKRASKAKPIRAKAKAKAPAKRAAPKKPRGKKAAPPKPQKLQIDVIEVETIENFAPGVAVVRDYEIIDVHPAAGDTKDDEPGSQTS